MTRTGETTELFNSKRDLYSVTSSLREFPKRQDTGRNYLAYPGERLLTLCMCTPDTRNLPSKETNAARIRVQG